MFSTTKGIVAIAVAMCVQRGLLDYDEKVATYWPEFAAHGKGDATVAQLLSHQCGLIAPDAPVTLAEALDWKTITAMLADTKPDWPIGTAHGYHAVTFGWLAGELIRRTDGRIARSVRRRRDRRPAGRRAVDRLAGGAGTARVADPRQAARTRTTPTRRSGR